MAAISDLIHNGANDLTGTLTGNLNGNLTGSTAPTPIQSGERRRALVARDLGLLHCCEGVASAFLGHYQEYGDVCQQGLQTMLDLCLDPTNRLKLGNNISSPLCPLFLCQAPCIHCIIILFIPIFTSYTSLLNPHPPYFLSPSHSPCFPTHPPISSLLPNRANRARNSSRINHDQYYHEKKGKTWSSDCSSL